MPMQVKVRICYGYVSKSIRFVGFNSLGVLLRLGVRASKSRFKFCKSKVSLLYTNTQYM